MKNTNNILICLFILLLFTTIFYKKQIIKNNNLIDNNLIDIVNKPKNQQQCYEYKQNYCDNINGNYIQCTNNYKYPLQCQCDQNSLNLDICDSKYNINHIDNNNIPKLNLCTTRVNIYNPIK